MNLEALILSHLICNEEYGRKALPFLKDEYFHDVTDKVIFNISKDYIDKYNAFPTKEALIIDLERVTGLNEETFKTVQEKIGTISIDTATELSWLLDQTEKFCQEKAIYNGIMASIKIIDDKEGKLDKGTIPKILQDALAVSFDTHIGHDLIEDWSTRYDLYHKVDSKIPFDLDYLNRVTNGGLSRKTFNVILGGTNVGKTLAMCHMAAANLSMGKNVLYITLEMAEERIAERIDANLLDVKMDEIRMIPKNSYQKKIEELKGRTEGKLIIKEYPTAAAGANHFRFLLNELRLKKDFVPDVIYIDYVNLCISSRIKFSGSVNSYTYVKAIAEEIRGLAVEYDVAIVSASQLNREGFADSDADITHTSESFGLPMTVDFMIVLISTEELESLNQYMVKQLKNRYTDAGHMRRFVIGVDKSKMRLYDVEQSAQDLSEQPVMDKTNYGIQDKIESKFDMNKFKGFK